LLPIDGRFIITDRRRRHGLQAGKVPNIEIRLEARPLDQLLECG
jgi:hypothetical protein